eukprot:10481468-Alexandrium_andersonii.AAC.2
MRPPGGAPGLLAGIGGPLAPLVPEGAQQRVVVDPLAPEVLLPAAAGLLRGVPGERAVLGRVGARSDEDVALTLVGNLLARHLDERARPRAEVHQLRHGRSSRRSSLVSTTRRSRRAHPLRPLLAR